MAYTAGPWSEHGKGGCPCGMIFGPDGNVLIAVVQGPSHLDDAVGPDCVPSEPAQKANARLIAAAPDLLDAIKCLRQHLALFCTPSDAVAAEIFRITDAIIAKAEGKV